MNKESVRRRLHVEGKLLLKAPLLIGTGSNDDKNQTDIQILKGKDGIPFIPGTSLTGVLRQYVEEDDPRAAALLFGEDVEHPSAYELKLQSSIILYDIKLRNAEIVRRDSVNIDGLTGTGIKQGKFDYEAIDQGAHGIFAADIIWRGIHEKEKELLDNKLERLWNHLSDGIHLGARTAIGFGRAVLEDIEIDCYDFQDPADTAAYFLNKPSKSHKIFKHKASEHAYPSNNFIVDADFALKSGLLVRDYDKSHMEDSSENSIDAIMLRDSDGNWLIPGTSLKGVLRHRAEYILQSMGRDTDILESLMGPDPAKLRSHLSPKLRSRFRVDEVRMVAANLKAYPQSRNRVDRFTGGTIDAALFTMVPVWQKDPAEKALSMHWEIHNAQPWEIGLALLLLKDMWLGKIAIGGGKSVGHGRLSGLQACLHYDGSTISLSEGKGVSPEIAESLQKYVDAFTNRKEAGA